MADVFISYSSKDISSAEYLLKTLESMYLTCWMAPRDIPKGENFAECIPSALRNTKVYLVLVSENSQSSVQVINELTFATHIGLPRIALKLDGVPLTNAFEYHITEENRYDGTGRLVAATSELVTRIHLEIEKQMRSPRKLKKDPKAIVPLLWLMLITFCAVILIGLSCICLTLQIITINAFLKAIFFFIVLALLAASLIRSPLFTEKTAFYRAFLKLTEYLLDKQNP